MLSDPLTGPGRQPAWREKIPLSSEIALERRHAGPLIAAHDNVSIAFRIPPHLRPALVPRFILRPLIDGSIRLAAANPTDQASISVEAQSDSEWLHLVVCDDGFRDIPAEAAAGRRPEPLQDLVDLYRAGGIEILLGRTVSGRFRARLGLQLEYP
jgi:hypothetical protein